MVARKKKNKIEELPFGFEGVGYIPLIPGSEDKDNVLIEFLKKTLNLANNTKGGERDGAGSRKGTRNAFGIQKFAESCGRVERFGIT